MDLLKSLFSPEAWPVLVVLVVSGWGLWRLERGRAAMLGALAEEVRRRSTAPAPEVRVQQPLRTTPEDPPVSASACELHRMREEGALQELRGRVERVEGRLDKDIQRIHERIDDLPQRILDLIRSGRGDPRV